MTIRKDPAPRNVRKPEDGVYPGEKIGLIQAKLDKYNTSAYIRLLDFPGCCALDVLVGFPGGRLLEQRELEHIKSLLMYVQGSYVLVTLNRRQMLSGIHKQLKDYFNFTPITDDFNNLTGSSNVCIFGVLMSEWSRDQIE